jgi:hypothetical protein
MNPLIEFLKKTEGTVFVNEDGVKDDFKLLPPLSEQELASFSSSLPCPIPADILELLKFSRGFDGTWLEEVLFADRDGGAQCPEQIFPHGVPLAHDGLGNSWIVDLTKESQSWGPIFYSCHDAPVVVYQTDSLLHFIQEVVRGGNEPWKNKIDDVWGRFSDLIWDDNPGMLSFSHCIQTEDQDIRAFAESLGETWQFIDLRNPVLGDGFSWARYGPKTAVKRCGAKRVFAYQKKSLGRRILDSIR